MPHSTGVPYVGIATDITNTQGETKVITNIYKALHIYDKRPLASLQAFWDEVLKGDCSGASSVDATCRCPRGTSKDACGPGGTSGAFFSDPENLSTTPRITKTPDIAGLFKAREIKEGERPPQPTQQPQEQRKTDEPTVTWEDENSTLKRQPNNGPGDQEAPEG
ncbi:hypothetical protein NDU88_002486 [Pleurodeles waltl]|uniref:Uncharacterized protein n=1 Tax=Pleurodeles waltl TaxID=8319 RepID=A0AAV7VEP6_PLEWA|nr:hypothetical protein NDU88_002486 [Pleurodeles waltl]